MNYSYCRLIGSVLELKYSSGDSTAKYFPVANIKSLDYSESIYDKVSYTVSIDRGYFGILSDPSLRDTVLGLMNQQHQPISAVDSALRSQSCKPK